MPDNNDTKPKRTIFGMLCGFILKFLLPLIILMVAIVVGYFRQFEMPEAVFFAIVFPLGKGHLPPPLFGHGKMQGTSTIPVPDDMVPQARPEGETMLELPFGERMPQAGLGMCCRASAYDDELVYRSVLWYLLSGGRLIDGADLYLNHAAIGRGIKEAMHRGIPREEIFVTTKLWTRQYGYNKTKEAVPRFLEELGLEYVDLVLMHSASHVFPQLMTSDCTKRKLSNKECRQETWKALSELREAGLTRNIGVSNFHVKHLEEISELGSEVAPIAVNQYLFNPFSPDFAVDTYNYCKEHGIAITAYGSLGGTLQHFSTQTVDTLEKVAKHHDTSISQIALRWAIQKNVAVIPGTGNPKHMRENLKVYDFELSEEEMKSLDELRNDEKAKEFFYMGPLD